MDTTTTTPPAAASVDSQPCVITVTGIMTHGALPPHHRDTFLRHGFGQVRNRAQLRRILKDAEARQIWRFEVESTTPRIRSGQYDRGREATFQEISGVCGWTGTLFASYSSLVIMMCEDLVTSQELADGLFLFGCTREHAMTLGKRTDQQYNEVWRHLDNEAEAQQLHARIAMAIENGEREGRVTWMKPDQHPHQPVQPRYRIANELLIANGFNALPSAWMDHGTDGFWDGNLPDLERRIAATNPGLEVLWQGRKRPEN